MVKHLGLSHQSSVTLTTVSEITMMDTPRTAAVLIIGDEILSGRTADTNVNTIARFLSALGIDLCEAAMVRDEESQIIEVLDRCRHRYDYVLTTGGIGPTHDDITASTVAKAFGVSLETNEMALELLEARATSMGVKLNDNSRLMARIPKGASLIKNPISAAPGFQIENVFVMAGVPKIMQAMLDDVAPRLVTGAPVRSRTLKLSYVGESWAADVLRSINQTYPQLSLGSYPFGLGIDGEYGTQLVVRGRDYEAVDAATLALLDGLAPVVERARQKQPLVQLEEIQS